MLSEKLTTDLVEVRFFIISTPVICLIRSTPAINCTKNEIKSANQERSERRTCLVVMIIKGLEEKLHMIYVTLLYYFLLHFLFHL